MSYSIKVSEGFKKKFRKLDFVTQRIISRWIVKNLENTDNPRRQGKALKITLGAKERLSREILKDCGDIE